MLPASSPPPDSRAISGHNALGPNRNITARAATPITVTASANPTPGRSDRGQLRVQCDRPAREMRPDLLRVTGEPAQPIADRVRVKPEQFGDLAMPGARPRLGKQHRADHLHRIATAQQTHVGQQHMRRPARPTTRPPRPQPHDPGTAGANPQRPLASMTPTTKHPAATRAFHPALDQVVLDPGRLGAYHHHRVPPRHSESPPGRTAKAQDGRALTR